MNAPPVIGLTGAIGSGKSTVAAIHASLGCVVSDADELAREELASPDLVEAMRERWGDDIIGPDDAPDREAIARRVFGDDSERAWLEGLIHPRVHARREQAFADADRDAPALVIDAPLLVEAGLLDACDHVIFVDAPPATRLERVVRDRGWDEAELERRESAQAGVDLKRDIADHVIDNDGDIEELGHRVKNVLAAIQGAS